MSDDINEGVSQREHKENEHECSEECGFCSDEDDST